MMAFLGNLMGKLLMVIYNVVSSIGAEPEHVSFYAMSIIGATILFKLILMPFSFHQMKSTAKMGVIQPEMKKIQEKYASDPQTQQVKMMDLYKEHNYNPASGCFVMLLQFPILIAFFSMMRDPVQYAFKSQALYDSINKSFLWISNLDHPDPYLWGLPLLAAATTYLQTLAMKANTGGGEGNPEMEQTQKMMNYMLPLMIFFSARRFPAGLALYWTISNLLTAITQFTMNKVMSKDV